jgi:hypothetical protein
MFENLTGCAKVGDMIGNSVGVGLVSCLGLVGLLLLLLLRLVLRGRFPKLITTLLDKT